MNPNPDSPLHEPKWKINGCAVLILIVLLAALGVLAWWFLWSEGISEGGKAAAQDPKPAAVEMR